MKPAYVNLVLSHRTLHFSERSKTTEMFEISTITTLVAIIDSYHLPLVPYQCIHVLLLTENWLNATAVIHTNPQKYVTQERKRSNLKKYKMLFAEHIC
jgi:hypothetical protein